MYKLASRNLQWAHRIDRPMPTGGMIGLGEPVEDDFIQSAGNMSADECLSELRTLSVELARAQNELIVAKRSNDAKAVSELGLRIQGYCARRSPLKTRIQQLRQMGDPSEILAAAIREIAPEQMQAAIFKRAKQLNKEKFG